MVNDSKKPTVIKSNISRLDQLKAAQQEWLQEQTLLEKEREELGFDVFTVDEFLTKIKFDEDYGIEQQSQGIALQEKYRILEERKKLLWIEDIVIDQLNIKHAIIHLDQTFIMTKKINALGNPDFSLESKQSFRTFYEDTVVVCADGKERCIADIWLKSPRRRKYSGMIFDPQQKSNPQDYYNLWKGFTKNPIQGNCQKYWDHVYENICSNDKSCYTYLRKWIALIFKHPERIHTAIVLCGSQGTGKNSFVNPLGELLGSHYIPLSSISELTSNFNYHLKYGVLIHCNESLWGGNKKELGTVKAMITEETCLIEGKGKDRIVLKNFKHLILSSNEDWPVSLDADDRRFFVIQVSDKRKEDHAYFQAIQEELNNQGYEALLYDLLHEDIETFNPRIFPQSTHAFIIKLRSADSCHRYIYEVLEDGGFSIGATFQQGSPVWIPQISKNSVYQDYVEWSNHNNETPERKEIFGKILKKLIPSVVDIRPATKGRVRCYQFSTLDQARAEFAQAFKETPQRIFNTHDTEVVPNNLNLR